MRTLIVASLTVLFASAVAMADEKKAPPVRALDVKVDGEVTNRFGSPVVIANAEQLARAIKDEAAVAAVKKAADFEKEQVVYFSWSGSGQDKLTFAAGSDPKGPDVIFTYTPGRTRDVRMHKKLFALPKDAKFKVVGP
jgi:hypothetical protein